MDSEALHRLRIDCKKLRYATEFFAPLYGERMVDFTQHLKALQDLLGTLHDTAVIADLHRDLLKGAGNSKLKRMARKLEKQRGKEAEEIMETLVVRWTEFSQAPRPWTTARKPRIAHPADDAQRESV
jgi:CHAD domain-containing protein